MKCNAKFPDVLACSIYDKKTVHIISTVADNVKWTPIKNKVYRRIEKNTVDMEFHTLNVIRMNSFGIGPVDVADELYMQYIPDIWMRNRNWW